MRESKSAGASGPRKGRRNRPPRNPSTPHPERLRIFAFARSGARLFAASPERVDRAHRAEDLPISDSAPPEGESKRNPPSNAVAESTIRGARWTIAEIFALIVLIVFALIRPFLLEPFFIPSDSMLSVLRPGDRILADKLSYDFRDPERGDIIVFYGTNDSGHPDEIFVKRVVGMPGEHLSIDGGETYIEGARIKESYLHSAPNGDLGTVLIPPRSYFVMGDNRKDSSDSRFWGSVPRNRIIGRAMLVFWPIRHFHLLR